MGLKPVSKKERRLADETEKSAAQALILETGKPPEKSVFSNNWKLVASTVAAAGVLAAAAITVAAARKKNDSRK